MPQIPITFHTHAPPVHAHSSQIINSTLTHHLSKKHKKKEAARTRPIGGPGSASTSPERAGADEAGVGRRLPNDYYRRHKPATWISISTSAPGVSAAADHRGGGPDKEMEEVQGQGARMGVGATATTSSSSSTDGLAGQTGMSGKRKAQTPSQRRKGVARMSYIAPSSPSSTPTAPSAATAALPHASALADNNINTTTDVNGDAKGTANATPTVTVTKPSSPALSSSRRVDESTSAYLRPLNKSIITRCLAPPLAHGVAGSHGHGSTSAVASGAPSATKKNGSHAHSQAHANGHGHGHGSSSALATAGPSRTPSAMSRRPITSSSLSQSVSHAHTPLTAGMHHYAVHPYSRATDLANDRSLNPSPREILRAERAEEEKQRLKKESAAAARAAIAGKRKKGGKSGVNTAAGSAGAKGSRAGTRVGSRVNTPLRSPDADGDVDVNADADADVPAPIMTRMRSADVSPNLSNLATGQLGSRFDPTSAAAAKVEHGSATVGLGLGLGPAPGSEQAPRGALKRTRSSGLVNISTAIANANAPTPGVSSPLRAVTGPVSQAPPGSFAGETPPANQKDDNADDPASADRARDVKRTRLSMSGSRPASVSPGADADSMALEKVLMAPLAGNQHSRTVAAGFSPGQVAARLLDPHGSGSTGMARAASAGAGAAGSDVKGGNALGGTGMRRVSSAGARARVRELDRQQIADA